MRSNRNKLMFECDACDELFPTQIALDHHLKRRLFKCQYGCGHSYVHQRGLFTHERLCGGKFNLNLPSERDKLGVECNECNGVFPSQIALDRHLESRVFKCHYGCGQSYVHQRELTTHQQFCGGKNKDYGLCVPTLIKFPTYWLGYKKSF